MTKLWIIPASSLEEVFLEQKKLPPTGFSGVQLVPQINTTETEASKLMNKLINESNYLIM